MLPLYAVAEQDYVIHIYFS